MSKRFQYNLSTGGLTKITNILKSIDIGLRMSKLLTLVIDSNDIVISDEELPST